MPIGVYPESEKSIEARRANGIYAAMNNAKKNIDQDLMIWSDIKKRFGKKEFRKNDVDKIIARHKTGEKFWLINHNVVNAKSSFLCFLEKSSGHRYRALETPIIKNKIWLLPGRVKQLRTDFGKYEIMDSIIDASIEYHNTKKETTMADKQVKELAPTDKIMFGNAPMLEAFRHEFNRITNIEKADIACLLNPLLEKGSVLAKFNELYPNYAMPNVKRGDMIFHPIAGKKEVVEADEKWIYFYGNGNRWKCDRDGYIDGDHSKPRSVWNSFDSYAKEMNR